MLYWVLVLVSFRLLVLVLVLTPRTACGEENYRQFVDRLFVATKRQTQNLNSERAEKSNCNPLRKAYGDVG